MTRRREYSSSVDRDLFGDVNGILPACGPHPEEDRRRNKLENRMEKNLDPVLRSPGAYVTEILLLMMGGRGSSTSSVHDDPFILLLGGERGHSSLLRTAAVPSDEVVIRAVHTCSEFKAEGDLLVSSGAVHEAYVSCICWADELGVC
ncbi:hypothetical protein L3X38_003759 [Prunus dulcis]|uniref:Uncharacterized protein n=1 Tax=Prunus dulcis TaxID=3755 RepID=A0AAD5F2I7_PRUDU|nr:hypothetical protein L3X38_003759 [Prunus dulcis]